MLNFSKIKEKIEEYTGCIEGLDKFCIFMGAVIGIVILLNLRHL